MKTNQITVSQDTQEVSICYKVEKQVLPKDSRYYEITHKSKNLYNKVNYILRQVSLDKFDNIPEYKDLIKCNTIKREDGTEKTYYFLSEFDVLARMRKLNDPDFRALPSQCAGNILKLIFTNWKSFYKSIKDYWKNPSKYKGKPRIPNYKPKDGHNIVTLSYQEAVIKKGYIHFPKYANLPPIKTGVKEGLQQVRILPRSLHCIMEVVYKFTPSVKVSDYNRYLGIDIGLSNLASCIDSGNGNAFIINGNPLKSMNQYFNKNRAKLMSYVGDKGTSKRILRLTDKRNNKITDYIHKSSKFIIDYCVNNNIGNIVVGHNKEWKQEINIGKKNNQNFVNIPHATFLNMLKYKAEYVGICIVTNEESYTSKCDALALEPIKKHEEYLGKRVKRGLFQSSTGRIINADINGAINILRKTTKNEVVSNVLQSSNCFNPVKTIVK